MYFRVYASGIIVYLQEFTWWCILLIQWNLMWSLRNCKYSNSDFFLSCVLLLKWHSNFHWAMYDVRNAIEWKCAFYMYPYYIKIQIHLNLTIEIKSRSSVVQDGEKIYIVNCSTSWANSWQFGGELSSLYITGQIT